MSPWERFLEFNFYHQAMAAGLGIALACGILSVFVVYKRMAFIGEGISHAGFGGAGMALLLGLLLPDLRSAAARDLIIGVFCVATAIMIGYLSRRGRVQEDSAIGVCLVAAMALGVVLMNIRENIFQRMMAERAVANVEIGAAPSFHDLLFGNILQIPVAQTVAAIVLGILALILTLFTYRQLVFFTFDEESAEAFGVPVRLIYYGQLAALGVTITLAMRLLGVILCTALLILPGVTAALWSRKLGVVIVLSVIVAMAAIIAGIFVSIVFGNLSAGPVIVLVLFAAFLVSHVADRVTRRLRSKRSQ